MTLLRLVCLVFSSLSVVGANESGPYKIALFTSSPEGDKYPKTDAIKFFCEQRVNEFNQSGGINGTPVELIYFDDHFNVDQLKSAVDTALDEERLIAILGIGSSTRGAAVVEKIGASGVPLISDISVDSLFRDYKNIYTMSRSASHATEVFLRFLEQQAATTVYIGSKHDLYADEFRKVLSKSNPEVEVLKMHLVDDLSPDVLRSIVSDVKELNPEMISLAMGSGGGKVVLDSFAKAGIKKPVYAATGTINGVLSGDETYGGDVYKIGPAIPHVDNERLARLKRRPDFAKIKSADLISWQPLGVQYADMMSMMVEGAGEPGEGETILDIRARIVKSLAGIEHGKRIYRGEARNWAFTKERAIAMDGLIVWRPKRGGDSKLFPRQKLETPSGLQDIPVVFTNIDMTRIFHVDSTKKTFDAEFYISLNSDEKIGLEDFEFTNAHRGADSVDQLISFREMRSVHVEQAPWGRKPRLYRVRGRFDFDPKLSKYPFDSQLFSISFQPVNTAAPFLFQPPPLRNRDREFEFKNWTLLPDENTSYVGAEEDIIATTVGYGSDLRVQTFKRYNFTWLAKRVVFDYYLQVVIPLALIVFVAYLSVFIPNSKFESVVAIQVTALLSSIALYLSIPKLSTETATISDQMFLSIQGMIGLMLMLSILRVNTVAKDMKKLTTALLVTQIVAFPLIALGLFRYIRRISEEFTF